MADLLPTNIQNILVQSLHDMFDPIFVQNHPFLDRMRKTKAGGSGYRIPIMVSPGGGAGSTFEDALANTQDNGSINVGFTCAPANVYGNEIIDWSVQPYTDTAQSPVDIAVLATKNSLVNCTQNLASMLFGTGHGDLATISTATNTSGTLYKLVLTVASDAAKFVMGNNLNSIAANYSALDAGKALVTGVNEIEGSILVDVGSSGLVPAAGHHIGLDGQVTVAVSGFAGVFGWVPPAASRTLGVVGDTFLGVTRTSASQVAFTSGWAWTANGNPLLQVVNAAAGYMATYKDARPDTLYVHPLAMPQMANELQQNVRYDIKARTANANVFYAGFTIITSAGPVDVLAEPAIPANQMLLTASKSWVFASPNAKIVGPATNGKILIDGYTVNKSRATVVASGFFGCDNLAGSAVITIGTPSGINL